MPFHSVLKNGANTDPSNFLDRGYFNLPCGHQLARLFRFPRQGECDQERIRIRNLDARVLRSLDIRRQMLTRAGGQIPDYWFVVVVDGRK
jgi:hypothetical protein